MRDGSRTNTTTIEFALLGVLADRPMHAYDLHKELSRPTGLGIIWSVKQARLYAIAADLEARGFLGSRTDQPGNRPARRVFHLTEVGRSAFKSWLSTPADWKDIRLDFLAKLYFARNSEAAVRQLLEAEQCVCRVRLARLRSQMEAANHDDFDAQVYGYRIVLIEATMGWMDACAAQLLAESVAEIDATIDAIDEIAGNGAPWKGR